MDDLIWICIIFAALIIGQGYRIYPYVRKVNAMIGNAKINISRTLTHHGRSALTFTKGRELPFLAFMTGFLIAIALRSSNAFIAWNNSDRADASFCGIYSPSMDTNGLNLIQDKVVFVTDTRFKLDQVSTLTKIGQSLFPVRNDVLWIIVSSTADWDLIRGSKYKNRTRSQFEREIRMQKNWNNGNMGGNRTRRTLHLTNLHNLLVRFGIPFVLMEMDCPSENWTCLTKPYQNGYGWGVEWTLANINRGVLMLGNEHFAYHHRIFKEVKNTRIASTWPVGLGKIDGFTAPIYNKSLKAVTGYFNGDSSDYADENMVPFDIGGAAVRIEYLQKSNESRANLLNALVSEEKLPFEELSIKNTQIQILGSKGDEILVWRTMISWEQSWPKTLRYVASYANSSVVKLWQNFFTIMFDQIPIVKFVEKNHSYYI